MKMPIDGIVDAMASKRVFMQIQVDQELKEAIQKAADKRFMSMSALMIQALIKTYPELVDEVLKSR